MKLRTKLFAAVCCLVACGVPNEQTQETDVGASQSALTDDNGLSSNGLGPNGLNSNGLNSNGLGPNGLGPNGLGPNGLNGNGLLNATTVAGTPGLGSAQFNTWFDGDRAGRAQVMKYFAKCAASSTQGISYSRAGVTYHWPGVFGLASSWVSGTPPTLSQKRWVSACMLAHVNANGQSVVVSFRAPSSPGGALNSTASEQAVYDTPEAHFYGNLFDSTVTKSISACDTTNLGEAGATTSCYGTNVTTGRACSATTGNCGMTVKARTYCNVAQEAYGCFQGICSYRTGPLGATSCEGIAEVVTTYVPGYCGDKYCDAAEFNSGTCADCSSYTAPGGY